MLANCNILVFIIVFMSFEIHLNNIIMKKTAFSLLFLFAAIVGLAQSADKIPYLTKSLSGEKIQNVEASTSGGSISVTGVSQSEAKIDVIITGNGNSWNNISKEEIKKRLDEDYELTIETNNGRLTAKAKRKNRDNDDWKKSLNISFRIYVPQSVSTTLSTSGGSISLKSLAGTQDFTTSGGSLHVEGLSGKIKGRTSGGSITLLDSKDNIDLNTSGGSITATNCTGDLRLGTSGGSLHLQKLKGTIDANTSGGSVHGEQIDGDLSAHTSGGNVNLSDISGNLETSTSGGNIDVELVNPGKNVRITNSSGNIDITLPKDKAMNLDLHGERVKVDRLDHFSGDTDEHSIVGTLNGGGGKVYANAGSGRVYVTLK